MAQSEALLGKLRQGSQEAFEYIFRTYYGRVFAVAYRLLGSAQEADDVAQEAFLRLYLRPLPLGREHNLAGWLMTVATNLGYNTIRSRQRRQEREARLLSLPAGELDPEVSASAVDASSRVRQALGGLPARQAQILLLRHSGLSYAELAIALEVAPGSVGTLLARAERAFRLAYEALENTDGDEQTVS